MPFAAALFIGCIQFNCLEKGLVMIALGVILLILALVFKINVLWTIGIILLVIGAALWILGAVGRPVAGRRYWY